MPTFPPPLGSDGAARSPKLGNRRPTHPSGAVGVTWEHFWRLTRPTSVVTDSQAFRDP